MIFVVVVAVVLTLTCIIKFVVTGQRSSHSGAEEYPKEKHLSNKPNAYITAGGAIHASTRNIDVQLGTDVIFVVNA